LAVNSFAIAAKQLKHRLIVVGVKKILAVLPIWGVRQSMERR